jgi:hypothetical protein
MKDLSKSAFIFNLAEEFQIFSPSGEANEFTDEGFNLFCDKYKSLSNQRDIALFQYLKSTPNLFRSHLPHSKWAIAVAFSVVWYYDELIVSDPILQLINSDNTTPEQKKYNLQRILAFLKSCRESIDGGFLLFSGDDITPNKTGLFESESKSLINIPQVLDAFEQSSRLLKKPSPINDNIADNLTQLEVMYEGLWGEIRTMGMYIPPHVFNANKLGNGISYDLITPYQRLTKEELVSFNKTDLLESLKHEYSKDISVILETITNAQRLNSPVLFYREADCIAAKYYAISNNKQVTNFLSDTTIYDCLVPYIDGIPAERLFDVRNQIPEAFKDFRAFLFELVNKTMKSTDNPAEFKFKIDSEINKMMRQLSIEMKNAKNKWRFQGIAAPLIMLTGSLSLLSSGIDYSKLLSTFLGSGGLIQGLNTWNNVSSDKNKSLLNPVYFLWKAQRH